VDDIGDRHQNDTGAVIGTGTFSPLAWFRFLAEFGSTLIVCFTVIGIVPVGLGHVGILISFIIIVDYKNRTLILT
jgi:hypothetical protein